MLSVRSAAIPAIAAVVLACGSGSEPAADRRDSLGRACPASSLILHPQSAVPGQYIVVLTQAVSSASVQATAGALAEKYDGQVLHVYDAALIGFAIALDDSKAASLAAEPVVCFVEQDSVMSVQ